MRLSYLLLLVPLALLTACGDAGPARTTVTDSAGVALVDNRALEGVDVPVLWEPREDLRIGRVEGTDSVTFGQVRGVAVDSLGRIYVLDQQAARVKVYGPDGRFQRYIGRAGEGPGELSTSAAGVLVTADQRVLVPDPVQTRMNRYRVDGTNAGTIPLPARPVGQMWRLGPDGAVIYSGRTVGRDDSGAFAFWQAILRLETETETVDTVAAFDDLAPTEIGGPGNLQIPIVINDVFWDVLPDGRIAWGQIKGDRVHVLGPDGALSRVIGGGLWQRAASTEAEREELREKLREKLDSFGDFGSMADGDNVVLPDTLPAITGIAAGPDRTIWVQRLGAIDAIDPFIMNAGYPLRAWGGGTWDVLDADGALEGRVHFPPRFRLVTMADGFAYGVLRDELEVQYVVRFALDRAQRRLR